MPSRIYPPVRRASNLGRALVAADDDTQARQILDVDSKAEVTAKANNAAETTAHNQWYYTKGQIDNSPMPMRYKTLTSMEVPADFSFLQDGYTKSSISNCTLKGGSISLKVDGVDTPMTIADQTILVNGSNDYDNTPYLTGKPTEVEFIVDNGKFIEIHGSRTFQVGFANRNRWGYSAVITHPKSVRIQVSADGIEWVEPADGSWNVTDAYTQRPDLNYWLPPPKALNSSSGALTTIRYFKYTFTDWRYDETYSYRNYPWFSQLIARHASEEILPQYAKSGGDEFLGDMQFSRGVRDRNGSAGPLGYVIASTGSQIEYARQTTALIVRSTDPTAADIPDGTSVLWRNSVTNEVRMWARSGGILYKSEPYST